MAAYEIDDCLGDLLVRDLPMNRRQQLSTYLNSEQVLMSDNGLARDYRGIAQQLNLSYSDICNLDKLVDPFGTLLSNSNVNKLSVLQLFNLIGNIGRFDILDDMIPILLEDLRSLPSNSSNKLTIHSQDDNCDTIWYDAYVCYADSDLDFVRRLAHYLESEEHGFRLFIRDRDLLGGNWVYETFAKLIESQCRRMIIVLSPEFLQCPDCKFQSQFAAGLAIEKCSRILIPIIYKKCSLPSMIRLLSKIDMSGTRAIPEWSLNRLVRSIRNTDPPPMLRGTSIQSSSLSPPPLSTTTNSAFQFNQIEYDPNFLDNTIITNTQKISIMDENKIELCSNTNENNIKLQNNDELNLKNSTNITVISDHNELSQLIDDDGEENRSKLTTSDESHNKSVNSNTNKSWIKSIKRKIKVSL